MIAIITILILNPQSYFEVVHLSINSCNSYFKSNIDNKLKITDVEENDNKKRKCDNPFLLCCHSGFTIISSLDFTCCVRKTIVKNTFHNQNNIQKLNISIWRPPKLI